MTTTMAIVMATTTTTTTTTATTTILLAISFDGVRTPPTILSSSGRTPFRRQPLAEKGGTTPAQFQNVYQRTAAAPLEGRIDEMTN
ncbi:hypothetical protein V1478_009672 [Vespula squamosa]|uniref:Secreted protein n=1 Tax=Vespula squamosa TaxID=30214 RepID=A0ABD2AQB5_VESSQ